MKKKLYITSNEGIEVGRANLIVKIADDFKMDVMFAPNSNLSLFPYYWWEYGDKKTRIN